MSNALKNGSDAMALQIAYGSLIVLGFIILWVLFIILYQKKINRSTLRKQGYARDILFKKYFDKEDIKISLSSRFFMDAFIDIESEIEIEPEVKTHVINDLSQTSFIHKQYRKLKSLSSVKRKIAIHYLSALNTEHSIKSVKSRLNDEKNESVRFYIIHNTIRYFNQEDVNQIMDELLICSMNYTQWIHELFKNNYPLLKPYLVPHFSSDRHAIQKFFIYLSRHVADDDLKNHIIQISKNKNYSKELILSAYSALSDKYPYEIATPEFFNMDDPHIQKLVLYAASQIVSIKMLQEILKHVDGSNLDQDRASAISRMIFEDKTFLLYLIDYYETNHQEQTRTVIAKALSHYVDYLVIKLKNNPSPVLKEIIDHILNLHLIEDFIDFVNQNKDLEIEQAIISILKYHMSQDSFLLNELSIYLKESILIKMGISKKSQPVILRDKTQLEKRKVVFIISWISGGVLLFPTLYFLLNFRLIFSGTIRVFEFMIINFNYYLVIYFLSINAIYLLLMILSLKESETKTQLWSIKKKTLLFEKDLLPSISIIAPAYNEEKSIIESVTSLLNLKYPKYEVIVVNDGSKDDTISVLIEHFSLERKHPFFKLKLNTKSLRGVYVNKHIPNLIVIDKNNGGKADALNMGINAAKYQYICGIDADSILDQDALLKLMSITLDHSKDYIAIGGNIVPVNGCLVDRGKIEHSGLGKGALVKYQTLEYLRAFSTGRIGWAKLNCLLIISGAFGLFQRKSLLETGGYLTISGDLKKDTVGEDMELVVRLTYESLSKKHPYLVDYVHHANCYTELPSDFISLLKQRNRWQRGLLDILSYHRRLLFNPKFKQVGFIAFPYFFFYEMVGPFVEAIGYISLILGFVLGILNLEIVLILLIVTIGLGIVISLTSLWIAERKDPFYSVKDTFILIFYAIIENFGYRQVMSLHRIVSTFSAIKESNTWGSQKRQGFAKKK